MFDWTMERREDLKNKIIKSSSVQLESWIQLTNIFQVEDLKLEVFNFQVSSFNSQVSSFKFQLSSFKFQLSSFNFQLSSFQFQLSSFNFQVSSFILPCAHRLLPSPSPSLYLAPTDHYLRPHPHSAMRPPITTFALTLTLPCAHWSLPSPSPSLCLENWKLKLEQFKSSTWKLEFKFQVRHIWLNHRNDFIFTHNLIIDFNLHCFKCIMRISWKIQ
jgi:hypothetical protein